jgi:hypothetical protein
MATPSLPPQSLTATNPFSISVMVYASSITLTELSSVYHFEIGFFSLSVISSKLCIKTILCSILLLSKNVNMVASQVFLKSLRDSFEYYE